MPWIESHTVLLRHRKVLQLADDLSMQPAHVVGHLHVLWHAVLEQQEDGDLSEWPDTMIAQAAAYTGDAKHFVSCLQARKWLDGKMVHDWLEYAGRYLTVKYRTANPAKLVKINKKHQSVSRSASSRAKVRSKTDFLTNLTGPNQPTEPTSSAIDTQSLMVDTVMDLWNQIPGVVKSLTVTGPIRKRLLCRLKERPGLDWWTTYFGKIKGSAFLTGRKTDFAATLDWVLGPKNMAKVLAGNYEDREPVIKESAIMEQARAFLGKG